MNLDYRHQPKREFDKNSKRVQAIVDRNPHDLEKQLNDARSQSKRITTEEKAFNRAVVAKDMGHEEIFEVFLKRSADLGAVSKQDYRKYKIEKLRELGI